MSTSGTTSFFPDNTDVLLEAYDRCGIRPASLTTDHLASGYRSMNLVQQTWANRGVNLWTVDLLTVQLVQGQSTYTLPADTIMVRDCYISQPTGGFLTDRLLYPISRNDYAAIPNKSSEGEVNTFWFNRQTPAPEMVLWLVPAADANITTLKIYRNRQIQDSNITGGQTADIPYRFIEAYCADLAARLAQKFAPQMWMPLKAEAAMAWQEASSEDSERVPFYIAPSLESYWG